MFEVTLSQLFLIDMIIDIDSCLTLISSQFLDEFARHPGPAKMGSKPMPGAMR
jgi:hypothetical protein